MDDHFTKQAVGGKNDPEALPSAETEAASREESREDSHRIQVLRRNCDVRRYEGDLS